MKRLQLSALILSAGLLFSGAAHAALTLSHVTWTADSFQTFSIAGMGSLAAAKLQVYAVGNTQKMPDATLTDPETGDEVQVPVFRFPVTKSKVKLFVDSHLSDTQVGWVTRSGLKFSRTGNPAIRVVLANFRSDFKNRIQYADIITPTETLKDVPAFTFNVEQSVYADIKKGRIVAKGSVTNMVMTPEAIEAIGDALKLSNILRAPLKTLDWGRVVVDVNNKHRDPHTNDKPLTAADVGMQPEPYQPF